MSSIAHAQGRHRSRRARHRRRTQPAHSLLLWPLLLIAGAAFIAFVYLGYVLWPRWPGPPVGRDAPPLPITVAGVVFNVPPAAIRVPLQRRGGAQERVDLAFLWPSLEPPEPSVKPAAPRPGEPAPPAPAIDRVFLTIARAGDSLDPAERVLTIYPRYTASEAQPGPDDLTVLPFRDGTPYQGEELIYDASAPGFLARCTRPSGPTPGTCLYERRIETADVVLRFPRDWLSDWRSLAATIERLMTRLRHGS